jgi:hypothetical protein
MQIVLMDDNDLKLYVEPQKLLVYRRESKSMSKFCWHLFYEFEHNVT